MDVVIPQPPPASRWQLAVQAAARQVLAARWRHALECLELARAEQAQLRASPCSREGAARRAARHVAQLERLRAALARELRIEAPGRRAF
jgi:hypothetical protein